MQPPQPSPDTPAPAPEKAAGQKDTGQQVEEDPMLYCPVCSMRLESRHCKLSCPQCGYYMSCADYY